MSLKCFTCRGEPLETLVGSIAYGELGYAVTNAQLIARAVCETIQRHYLHRQWYAHIYRSCRIGEGNCSQNHRQDSNHRNAKN
jgi:hypothetical protein